MFWIYFTIAVVFDTLSAFFAKKFSLTDNPHFLWAVVFSFLIMGLAWAQMIQFKSITIANILWIGVIAVSMTAMGVLLFDEKISPLQWAGITIVLIGVVMINWPQK